MQAPQAFILTGGLLGLETQVQGFLAVSLKQATHSIFFQGKQIPGKRHADQDGICVPIRFEMFNAQIAGIHHTHIGGKLPQVGHNFFD